MGWVPSFKECGMAPFDYYPGSEDAYARCTYPLMMTGIPLEDKNKLPEAHAVYFAVSKKTGLLYIGRAKNLHARWQNHHRIEQLKRYGDVCISWITFANLETEHLHALEAAYVDHFLPPPNPTMGER